MRIRDAWHVYFVMVHSRWRRRPSQFVLGGQYKNAASMDACGVPRRDPTSMMVGAVTAGMGPRREPAPEDLTGLGDLSGQTPRQVVSRRSGSEADLKL